MVTRLDLENAAALKRIAAALEEIAKLLAANLAAKSEKGGNDNVHA
jgi:hypothetical protein